MSDLPCRVHVIFEWGVFHSGDVAAIGEMDGPWFIQNLGFWPYSAIDVYRESILRVASKKALQGERTGTVSVTFVST
jgi:hypothetical protein